MLHLRIIVPPDLTPSVERLLVHEPGAVHLTVVPGAARDPAGDLIEVDVERAALRAIMSRLEDLHVPDRGSIALIEVDDIRSSAADEAAAALAPFGEELIAWDEVTARTRDDTSLTGAYALLMLIAGVIAAAGILSNNEILVVGGMIVSPEYGAIAGFCVATVVGFDRRARSSATALVVGFLIAACAAFMVSLAARLFNLVPADYLAGDRPLADLVSEPNVASLIVSLAAGVAGMIALGQVKSGAIVGVLVSVTTIPAVANVGVALAFGDVDEALHAAAQLLINVTGLIVAGVSSLLIGRRLSQRRAIAELRHRRRSRREGPRHDS